MGEIVHLTLHNLAKKDTINQSASPEPTKEGGDAGMIVQNGASKYDVGKRVAETAAYRIYLCEEVVSGRQCLLRIAAEVEHNGGLDREAYVLGELERLSNTIEAAYAEARGNPDSRLQYDRLFPKLMDSFVCEDQGKRRINILAFRNIDEISKMVPLSNLAAKDRLRIDLRTSAWIMGRLLKLLVFVHGEGITVRMASGNNILLEPKKHYMVFFDWSSARMHHGKIPSKERADDIAAATRAVIAALGGNPETATFLDVDEETRQYTDYLLRLASHHESNAERAHQQFYEIVDALWKREYYPFTTKPLAG